MADRSGEHAARVVRLAMFPMLTRKNAASRLFCYQWVDPLRSYGISASVHPPSPITLFELLCERGSSPVDLALKGLYWYGLVPVVRMAQMLSAARAAVVL